MGGLCGTHGMLENCVLSFSIKLYYYIPVNIVLTGIYINPLNAKLNTICHLLSLFGAHHILHVSRIRVNKVNI